jgi:hypothetical protein
MTRATFFRMGWVAAALAALTACGNTPPVSDWQLNAKGALERATQAYFTGNLRVEVLEFERARSAIASTGQVDQLARAELLRCATRVASMVVEPCAGFAPLRQDVPAPEQAYADYLAAQWAPAAVPLLPAAQRAVAAAQGDAAAAQAVKGIEDPLSRLVAAGVLFKAGRASPEVIALAVDTASAQGWRRPLMAWLGVQLQRAEQAGATDEAARIRRRLALVQGER